MTRDDGGVRYIPAGSCTWCGHPEHQAECPCTIRTRHRNAAACPCKKSEARACQGSGLRGRPNQ